MTTKFRTIQSKLRLSTQRRRLMQGGTIAQRKADTFIPNEYLEKVLAANPNCWGATLVSEGELKLNSGDKGATLDFVQETMKSFPDKDITFYFGHADAAISLTDIPPYELIVKQDGDEVIPQIVGFFDGNFPAFDKPGSSHPPEYHLAVDYLIPKLQGLLDLCDNDLDKVTVQLQKPHFKKELLLTSVSRGTITLVCANGVALTFAQSDLSAEFPWGWVSNHHGYKTEAAKPAEPVKKPSMFDRVKEVSRSTVREKVGGQPSEPDAVTDKTKQLAEAVAAAKTDTVIKVYSTRKWKPNPGSSRSQRKDQYKERIGYLPTGWKDGVEIDVFYSPEGKYMTFSQVKALGMRAAEVMALAKNPPQDRGKDTEPEHIPQPDVKDVVAGDKQVTAEVLPIMSPATREHIKDLMKSAKVQKIIAENADIIQDPKTVQAIEAKFADFARQLGAKSIDEFIPWSYEMMLELGKARPDGLAVLCWTFRNIVAAHRTKVKAEAPAEAAPVVEEPKKKLSMFDRVRATG